MDFDFNFDENENEGESYQEGFDTFSFNFDDPLDENTDPFSNQTDSNERTHYPLPMIEKNKRSNLKALQKKKKQFTPAEDQHIIDHVKVNGPNNWSKLAETIKSRTAKQLRERWNTIDPNRIQSEWTSEEDQMLFDLFQQLGNKWAKIASILKRSDTSVKNRWRSKFYSPSLVGTP